MIKGYRLKQLRENRGLTQNDLGKIIHVTKASVCCYEKGTRIPSIENLVDLASFFDVSIDYLVGIDDVVKIKYYNIREYVTKEELDFLKVLKSNKSLYDEIMSNPKKYVELVKEKVLI